MVSPVEAVRGGASSVMEAGRGAIDRVRDLGGTGMDMVMGAGERAERLARGAASEVVDHTPDLGVPGPVQRIARPITGRLREGMDGVAHRIDGTMVGEVGRRTVKAAQAGLAALEGRRVNVYSSQNGSKHNAGTSSPKPSRSRSTARSSGTSGSGRGRAPAAAGAR